MKKNLIKSLLLAVLIVPTYGYAQSTAPTLPTSLSQLFPSGRYMLLGTVSGLGTLTWYNHSRYIEQLTWPWETIENNKNVTVPYPATADHFPKNFLWGVGTSSYQVEGNCFNSTYEQWSQQSPEYKEQAGIACDHWNRYREDIQRMKQLHIKAYRFSLEWSTVEPDEGIINQEAISHYVDVCKELINNNIKPVIEFHHYSDPQWFIDKGGFERTENIHLFVNFCTIVVDALTQKLPHLFSSENPPFFLTFNSPASYAANGYLTGTRPPGKQSMQLMLTVLKNMLEAHVQLYTMIKQHPQRATAHVGITHNIYQLDPACWSNPMDQIKCYFGNKITHDCIYEFFRTGTFKLYIPTKAYVYHHNNLASQSLDFIGLNYYCHGYMGKHGPQPSADEIPTDNPRYTIYAEGLYRAIKELSDNLTDALHIPIYVTENGIGTRDDAKRDLFFKRYMYALARSIHDGYNVQGYIHWSFMDNYEWGTYDICYGIFAVNRETLERSLRPGARYFTDLLAHHGA